MGSYAESARRYGLRLLEAEGHDLASDTQRACAPAPAPKSHQGGGSLSKTTIISITQDDVKSSYWDMQVLDTNNYVTEDGAIHHNSGKTFVGCLDLITWAATHTGHAQAYYGPTYAAISDIFYPTFEEAAHLLGFETAVHLTNKEVDLYRGGFWYGKIICRSMDKPAGIIGYKVARSLVDEIDVLDPKKARAAWIKIIARLRVKIPGVLNDVGVTTTPEGFRFVYSMFADNPTESYSMVQASTYENAKNLPDDYIDSLLETYTAELVAAYLNGQFVNLTSGTIYTGFNRVLNATSDTEDGVETLHIGMDFNVQNMAAVVHVTRDGEPRAVDEFVGLYDTPTMIEAIKARYPDREIIVYPDASGKNRKTSDATLNDHILLEQAGFMLDVSPTNPSVRARIVSMNAAFCNAKGERHYKVNVEKCPQYAKGLEQQCYKNGEPDKTGGFDHANDAGGYYIHRAHGVERPMIMPPMRMGY